MNTKKNKNKNKPKPVSPNTSQIEEVVQNVEKELKPVVSIENEERVPEIVSEIIPQIQEKLSESETPKKPKRNRGKKNKSDKDDELMDESQVAEKKSPEIKKSDEKVKLQSEMSNLLSLNEPLTETVIPTARKKHKKNKQNFDQPENQQQLQNLEIQGDSDITTLICKESTKTEQKTPKKKNKKKKRNDSERSEELAVTAAFQKLLEAQSDIKGDKPIGVKEQDSSEIVTQESKKNIEKGTEPKTSEPSKDGKKSNKKNKKNKKSQQLESDDEHLKSESESQELTKESKQDIMLSFEKVHKPVITEKIETKTVTKEEHERRAPTEIAQNLEGDAVTVIPETSTTKKKNKKDKKQVFQCEVDLQQSKETPDLLVTDSKVPLSKPTESIESNKRNVKTTENIPKNEGDLHKDQFSLETQKDEKEVIPKYKAKIAKPVERNPKETLDLQSVKTDTEKDYPTETHSAASKTGKQSSDEIKDLEAKSHIQTPPTIQQSDLMSENNEAKLSLQQRETVTQQDLALKLKTKEIIDLEGTRCNIKSESAETERPETVATDAPASLNFFEEQSERIENSEDLHGFEISHNKKKKKSLKSSKNKQKDKAEDSLKPDLEITKAETEQDQSSSTTTPSLLQEIEIQSVKTEESEGSICDITPDIHYPRSSSVIDDNNNTSIQEILSDLSKSNVSMTSPLIHGSGETPLLTPELRTCGVEITEIGRSTVKQSEEKTDLKSKVMEVNKDMEELRRSIERSLAELTAIESEENKENPYKEAQIKITGTTDVKMEQTPHSLEELKKAGVEKLAEIIAEQKFSDIKGAAVEEIAEKVIEPENQSDPVVSNPESIELTKVEPQSQEEQLPAVQPAKPENKGKSKSKKKGKQDVEHSTILSPTSSTTSRINYQGSTSINTTSETKVTQETKKEENLENNAGKQEKTKQQSDSLEIVDKTDIAQAGLEPIETFEDAMTSSTDAEDVNKTFEIIAREAKDSIGLSENKTNPEICITVPVEDEKQDKQSKRNPVSPSKNLLGHPDIPVRLNRPDYKKEKNKTPNTRQAKVKIKDNVPIEMTKQSKESQTENRNRFLKHSKSTNGTISCMTTENEDFVYKYSFRKVFLPNACHICKKDLKKSRVPCSFCNLVFYCSPKHKDEDYQQHQGFCFAVSTIAHLKDHKHIYADSQNVTGHDYRVLRMQMIVSCEKVLKRKLHPWEQEALLYPRLCADVSCREWRQGKLTDCEGCGQTSFCTDKPDHLPNSHKRWCKSYLLYHKLVCYQQTKGRLEPKLPTKVMTQMFQIPEKFNEVLASMYEEKIDMNDIHYAALTQIATAPLTAAYCYQLYTNKMNASYANGVYKKSSFTIHLVGAELQFEADALNKWELFFLHLRPDVKDLRVVLIGQELNPSNLPLDLLSKIKLCDHCRQNKRRVILDFQDKKSYQDYWATDFVLPDLVCAFNPSIQRSSIYNGKDTWPSTIKCITKLKVPFVITSYTLNELNKDLAKVKSCSEVNVSIISEPKLNTFTSIRPDRNFISDDEMPLLFKNYCFSIVSGAV